MRHAPGEDLQETLACWPRGEHTAKSRTVLQYSETRSWFGIYAPVSVPDHRVLHAEVDTHMEITHCQQAQHAATSGKRPTTSLPQKNARMIRESINSNRRSVNTCPDKLNAACRFVRFTAPIQVGLTPAVQLLYRRTGASQSMTTASKQWLCKLYSNSIHKTT